MQVRRASSKLSEKEKQELISQVKEANEISISQLSFDSRIDNLDKLINLLDSILEYSPNETGLQGAFLTALLQELRAKNDAVISAPIVKSEINGGNCQITGDFTPDEARCIAAIGNNGELPLLFEIVN